MRLVLFEVKALVADKILNEDAFEMWLNCRQSQKHKAGVAAFYSRKNISTGANYLSVSFADEETGELLEINCYEKMHMQWLSINYILNLF